MFVPSNNIQALCIMYTQHIIYFYVTRNVLAPLIIGIGAGYFHCILNNHVYVYVITCVFCMCAHICPIKLISCLNHPYLPEPMPRWGQIWMVKARYEFWGQMWGHICKSQSINELYHVWQPKGNHAPLLVGYMVHTTRQGLKSIYNY